MTPSSRSVRGRIAAPWLALALLIVAGGFTSVVRADSASERLKTFLVEVKSLKSNFEQRLYDENLTRLEDARGVVYLERPGHFRWDYETPYPQVIVADGERVWLYDSELAQVSVKPMDLAAGNTPALLLTTDQPLEESFEVTDLGNRGGLDWVNMTPKSPESTFTSVRVAFDGAELSMMELVDSFGQLTQIKFTDIEKNPSLDATLFVFTPPAGVDVVGEGGDGGQ